MDPQSETQPFMDMIVAMDEDNNIARQGKLPWGSLPTDHLWYKTHATTTRDPAKRVGLLLGRLTFEDMIRLNEKQLSRWHMIVITQRTEQQIFDMYPHIDHRHINIVNSFEQGVTQAKQILKDEQSQIEFFCIFGGAEPYNLALKSKLVRRLYLTRIFHKFSDCDARVSALNLNEFRRIKRPKDEPLADLDDAVIEENGFRYQFQVYDFV